jgi:hypothetical protein
MPIQETNGNLEQSAKKQQEEARKKEIKIARVGRILDYGFTYQVMNLPQ